MIKPLSPQEVEDNVELPDYVIKAVNKLLKQSYRNGKCILKQCDIVDEILKIAPKNITRDKLFDKHYMDLELVYVKVGWRVTYDKPAYNENYEPTYKFERYK